MSKSILAPKSTPAEIEILIALLDGPKSRAQLGRPATGGHHALVQRMIDEDLVKVAGKVETGRRGRPPHVLALKEKGRKRAKRAVAKI